MWRNGNEVPELELLNSFFLADLSRVKKALSNGNAGRALNAYLEPSPGMHRRDVRREIERLEEVSSPERLPLARWPIPGGHSLVLMQQATINHVTRELGNGGLVGVNGPPGTGKTTLLRDIIAKVVLDRASALAELETPNEAFSHVAPIQLGRGFMHLYELPAPLLGHEIVVTSSNNKAVENVSRELPGMAAIDQDVAKSISYFSSVADLLTLDTTEERKSWGLAAAVLGNKANRNAFVQDFWWHPERGMGRYLRAIVEGWDPDSDENAETPEVARLENAPRNEAEALERWQEARREFRSAYRIARVGIDKLEEGRRASKRLEELTESLIQTELALERARESLATRRQTEAEAAESLDLCKPRYRECRQRREDLILLRPGFFSRLFQLNSYSLWKEQFETVLRELEQARNAEIRAELRLEDCRTSTQESELHLKQLTQDVEDLTQEVDLCKVAIFEMQALLDDAIPVGEFWSQPSEILQTSSPWLGRAVQEFRDQLLVASFNLHRAFIDAAARRIRHNLAAALAVMQGRPLSEKQEPARKSLWATLCLVVPVLSTTFASFPRLFGKLGPESLGWLLIDEAGQALPQAAVGAIWRARRAVVVGDPMQIEPVVTTPQSLIGALYRQFEISPERWAAPFVSAQSLADRGSWLGTYILRDDGDLWVGCPLRVHRRCQEPMFSISNQIAYGGFMVDATPIRSGPIAEVLGESRWLDIRSPATIGKWSETEGLALLEFLKPVLNAQGSEPDLFVITPFRIVAQKLRGIMGSSRAAEHARSLPRAWVQERVGTVHTFQGKEAEAVVLVLGAPHEAHAGARHWAGSSPNLLNVAVSRAKQRLYVIGNRDAWKDAGVFRKLATTIPQSSLQHTSISLLSADDEEDARV